MEVSSLRMVLFDEWGQEAATHQFAGRWGTLADGQAWAERVLQLTPSRALAELGHCPEAAAIEDYAQGKVLWVARQTRSIVHRWDAPYRAMCHRYGKVI